MPQISVDYSERLADSFDRAGFGVAVNRVAEKTIGADLESCKLRFRRVEEPVVVGDRAGADALVLVAFEIFPGRSAEAKARLSEAVLAALPEYLSADVPVQAAVTVAEIDRDSYRKATF